MRWIGLLLLVVAFALTPSGDGTAQVCRTVYRAPVYHAPVYHAPAYVAPVYEKVYVSQYLQVPVAAYPITYAPYQSGAESQQLQIDILKLRLELARLEITKAQAPLAPLPTQPQKQGAVQAPEGVKLFGAKCSACHDAATKAKGGGLVLTQNGTLAPLTDRVQLMIVKEVYSGRMPKGGKLTDEEVGAFMSFLDSLK